MRKHILSLIFILFAVAVYGQYSRDGKGIKFIQLEGCKKNSDGSTCDSCFVITNGLNGKLNRCVHISQLRQLINGGGGMDSTYLIDNEDGTYSMFNENGDEYQFGYTLDVSANGDTLFLEDMDGHIADYLLASDFDNQTLSWDPATKSLGIANGNTVILNGLNGIYGGSGVVPDSTYANVEQDSTFAIGAFPSLPGTNNSDRGIILGGTYVGLQGIHFFGGQKLTGRYGNGRITCDDVKFKVSNPFTPYVNEISMTEDLISLSRSNFGSIQMTDSLNIIYPNIWQASNTLGLEINGTRGTDGQVLTSYGSYAVWADPCCDTMEAGGGVDSISLGISGNVMTMGVNALTDTSLIIGELNTNLSGNIITTEVNNVIDTTLSVGNVTSSLSGTILTTSVNGVSDTAQLSGILSSTTNVLTYANPVLTSTVNGVTDTALVSISGVANVDLDLSGNVITSVVDGVSDTSLVIGELNTNLSGNVLTTEANNVTDTSLVIGSNVLSWNATDKILTSSINGVSDTSFVTGLNGIYSGSGNVPDGTYSELLTNEEFAIGYFTDFGFSILPSIDRGVYLKTNGTYIVGGDSTNTVRNSAEFLTDGIQIWSDTASMESRIFVNKDSLVNRVMYTANNEGGRIGMWGDSMKLQQDYNNLIIQCPSITLNDHGGTGRGTSGMVWHSNGTSGYWDNVSGGASSNTLSLSGNTMTSNVDGVIDTSLVIGEATISHQTNLNVLELEINNITDSCLLIHNFTLGVVGNTLTSTINGVPASTTVILKDSLELSGNTMQLMVNGVYDTCVVIGELNTNLSGNILTTEVNNVADTTLVVGSNVLTFAGDSLSVTINDVQSNKVYLPNVTDTDDQYIDTLDIISDSLRISLDSDGEAAKTVDLSGYLDNTDAQTLSWNGGTGEITISGGNTVDLDGRYLQSEVDGSTSNEIQTLSITGGGGTINLSLGGGSVTLNDSSSTNEIQQIDTFDLSGNTLRLSLSADNVAFKSVDLSGYLDNTDTQDLSITGGGGTIRLVDGGSVVLNDSSATNELQTLSWNGTNGELTVTPAGNTVDLDGRYLQSEVDGSTTNEIQVIDTFNRSNDTIYLSLSQDGQAQKYVTIPADSDNQTVDTFDINNNYLRISLEDDGVILDSVNLAAYLDNTDSQQVDTFEVSGDTLKLSLSGDGEPYNYVVLPASGGSVSSITPAQITSDQDNYNPTGFDDATIVRISGDDGLRAITSLAAQDDGEEKVIINVGDYPIYFPGEHPDGVDSNRITSGADIWLWKNEKITALYDNTANRWVLSKGSRLERPSNGIMRQHSLFSTNTGDYPDFATNTTRSGGLGGVGASSFPTISPAALHINTATSAGGTACIGYPKSSYTESRATYDATTISACFALTDTSTSTDRYIIYVDWATGSATTSEGSNNTFGLRYCDSLNSGMFQLYNINNTGTLTTADLSYDVPEDKLMRITLEVNLQTTEMRCYIDEEYAGRLTVSVSSSSTQAPRMMIRKTAGTTLRYCLINEFSSRCIRK